MQTFRVHIGIDFGGNGSKHSFVAIGILPEYSGVIALTSQRIEPYGMDADYLGNAFMLFAETVFAKYGEILAVYCDSAEQVLIQHLRSTAKRSKLSWLSERIHNSKKIEINDRIRLTSILMGGGRFFYLPTAETLRDALCAALWSDKNATKDIRLDDGTTDIDTLDAFEYTIERYYNTFLKRGA